MCQQTIRNSSQDDLPAHYGFLMAMFGRISKLLREDLKIEQDGLVLCCKKSPRNQWLLKVEPKRNPWFGEGLFWPRRASLRLWPSGEVHFSCSVSAHPQPSSVQLKFLWHIRFECRRIEVLSLKQVGYRRSKFQSRFCNYRGNAWRIWAYCFPLCQVNSLFNWDVCKVSSAKVKNRLEEETFSLSVIFARKFFKTAWTHRQKRWSLWEAWSFRAKK